MFSLEQLLFAVASDVRTNNETLTSILPMLMEVYEREVTERDAVKVNFHSIPNEILLTLLNISECWCKPPREDPNQRQQDEANN